MARVVVYSAAERRYCEPLLAGFRTCHPDVDVDFQFDISVALDRRFRAEVAAGQRSADVVWSSAMDLQAALVRDGHALPVDVPNAASLPPGSVYRSCGFATTREPVVTLVDRSAVGGARAGSLAEIADLLNADPLRFQGRVVAYDFERNGLGFLVMLHERRKREGFDRYVEAMRAAKPRLHGSNPPIVDELATGKAVLAAHVLGSYAERAVALHSHLAIARSDLPWIGVARVALVSRHAANVDAAIRFVDYLLSDDGQARVGAAGLYPLRGDMSATVRQIDAIPFDASFDVLLDPVARNDLLERWRAVAHALPA